MERHPFIRVQNNMKENIVISLASVRDAQAIARLNLLFNEVDESAETIAARMSDPNCLESVFLAKVADEAVGFALVRVVPSVLYATTHAELTELYVLEEFRQQGIASDLIAFAEEVAAQKAHGVPSPKPEMITYLPYRFIKSAGMKNMVWC